MLAALPAAQAGQWTLAANGQVRCRYEYQDGFTLKAYQPGDHDRLLLGRVRLDLSMRFRDRPRLFLQLQDAHAFASRFDDEDFPTSNPIEDALDIRQFNVEWLRIAGSPLGFKIGRQQISYGDQRVFGPGNWGNTGRYAWDAAMLKIDTGGFWVDLWAGKYLRYKTAIWPNPSVDEFLTCVGYAHLKKLPYRLEPFYVYKRDWSGIVTGESGAGNLRAHTVGLQAEGPVTHGLDAGATFAAQFGRHGRDRLRAYGGSARVGGTLPRAWTPRLGGQYTWGSGDANPSDGIHGTFDGVYGGRDIFFYGYLNLFFWANLHDAQIDVSVRPRRELTLFAEFHHLRLDQARDAWYTTSLKAARRDPSGRSGKTLGNELDIRAVLALGRHLELMAGHGRFFPGPFVRDTGPAAEANWYFAQASYSW